MSAPPRSARADGRGHWPAGKLRTTLTPPERRVVLGHLRAAVRELHSMRAVGRALGISDRSVRRALDGTDQPTERLRTLLRRLPAA